MNKSGKEQRPYHLGGMIWVSYEGLLSLIEVNLRGTIKFSRTQPRAIAHECLKKAGHLAEMADLSLPSFSVRGVQGKMESDGAVSAMHPYLDHLLVELSRAVISGEMPEQRASEQYYLIKSYHLRPSLSPGSRMPSELLS